MTRIQFWILTGSCLLVGILFLGEIPVTLQVQSASRELRGMNILIREGEESQALWQKMAVRAYQLGQQDAALKLVLSHQKINITPAAGGSPTPAAPRNGP